IGSNSSRMPKARSPRSFTPTVSKSVERSESRKSTRHFAINRALAKPALASHLLDCVHPGDTLLFQRPHCFPNRAGVHNGCCASIDEQRELALDRIARGKLFPYLSGRASQEFFVHFGQLARNHHPALAEHFRGVGKRIQNPMWSLIKDQRALLAANS